MIAPDRDGSTVLRRAAAGAVSTLPIAGLWALAALLLSQATGRITDWFIMTDELLYERLALSVTRTLSPLPTLSGVRVPVIDQLYPLLIAPIFGAGTVPQDLHRAHLLGAWLMSSACVPSYLLARRVTGRRSLGLAVGLLTVCVPWIVYSSFLVTEVIAYPAFAWAMLGLHNTLTRPSARNDVLALLGLAVAFFSRTQFAVLALVLPLAFLAYELRRRSLGRALRAHRVLLFTCLAAIAAVAALATIGHLQTVFGVYGNTLNGPLLPPNTGRSFLQHLATLALGLGVLPVVVGGSWLLASVVNPPSSSEAHAFACLAAITVVLLTFEVTVFDLELGGGLLVYDRYLFYLAPLFVLAAFCSLAEPRRLAAALVVPGALLAAGFALDALPSFQWERSATLDPDAPVAGLYRPLVRLFGSLGGMRVGLALVTIALTVVYVVGFRVLQPRLVAGSACAFLLVAAPLATVYDFHRLFGAPDWADRPLTGSGNGTGSLGWVDATLGPTARVTMIPSQVSRDYFVSLTFWRDLEFWNKSVVRDAAYPSLDSYAYTGGSFPKVLLAFDPSTGAVSVSPTPFVVQSVTESRFRLAGNVQVQTPQAMLIDAGLTWRLSWLTDGLYDDGWMQPGLPATIRVFAAPGQRSAEVQFLDLQVVAPALVPSRPFRVASDLTTYHGSVTTGVTTFVNSLRVCVPAVGYSDVRVTATGRSTIPGDLSSESASVVPRQGSVDLADISVSNTFGGPCVLAAGRRLHG